MEEQCIWKFVRLECRRWMDSVKATQVAQLSSPLSLSSLLLDASQYRADQRTWTIGIARF